MCKQLALLLFKFYLHSQQGLTKIRNWDVPTRSQIYCRCIPLYATWEEEIVVHELPSSFTFLYFHQRALTRSFIFHSMSWLVWYVSSYAYMIVLNEQLPALVSDSKSVLFSTILIHFITQHKQPVLSNQSSHRLNMESLSVPKCSNIFGDWHFIKP